MDSFTSRDSGNGDSESVNRRLTAKTGPRPPTAASWVASASPGGTVHVRLTSRSRIPRVSATPMDIELPADFEPPEREDPPADSHAALRASVTSRRTLDRALSSHLALPVLSLALLAFHALFAAWTYALALASTGAQLVAVLYAVLTTPKDLRQPPPGRILPTNLRKYPAHLSAVFHPPTSLFLGDDTSPMSIALLALTAVECSAAHLSVYSPLPKWGAQKTRILAALADVTRREDFRERGYARVDVYLGLGVYALGTLSTQPPLIAHPDPPPGRALSVHLLSHNNSSLPHFARTVDAMSRQGWQGKVGPEELFRRLNPAGVPDPCMVVLFDRVRPGKVPVGATDGGVDTAAAAGLTVARPHDSLLSTFSPLIPSPILSSSRLYSYPPHLLRTTHIYTATASSTWAARTLSMFSHIGSRPSTRAYDRPGAVDFATVVTKEGVSARGLERCVREFAGSEQRYGK